MEVKARATYHRMAEELKQRIMTREFSPGQLIPSESQLAETYGVSRMTARQGIGLLVENGYVYPVPGKGYFVAEPTLDKIVFDASEGSIFGQKVKAKLNKVDIVVAVDILADKLDMRHREKVLRMERLLLSREGPVAVDHRYLPYRKGQPLVEKELHYADFPEIVAHHSEVMLARSDFTVAAILLNQEEARLLEANAGLPALCIEQVLYDITEKPLGWSRMVCRSDRFVMSGAAYPYSGRV